MTDKLAEALPKFEARYHNAMPGWVKVVGLDIKAIHECEGGGFAIRESHWASVAALLGGGWRSIDSAPKDGTRIIALDNALGISRFVWWLDAGWSVIDYGPDAWLQASHWMPLPALPGPATPTQPAIRWRTGGW